MRVDDIHTLLESIGQVAYVAPSGYQLSDTIPNRAFWEQNDPAGLINATYLNDNGNMMVYHFMVRWVLLFFGTNQPYFFSLASVSGFLVTIFLVFRIGDRLFNRRIATVAAIFATFNASLIDLSVSRRSYSPAIAIGLMSTACYLKLIGFGQNRRVDRSRRELAFWTFAYGFVSLVGFYCHFQLVTVLLAHVIYSIMRVRDRRIWLCLVISGSIVALTVFSWMFVFGGSDAMKSYPNLSRYISIKEKIDNHNMFGAYTTKNIIASVANNLSYFLGFDKILMTNRVVWRAVPLAILGLLLVFRVVECKRLLFSHSEACLFLAICMIMPILVSLVRSFSTQSLFGMSNNYQSFSIPYALFLLAFVGCAAFEEKTGSADSRYGDDKGARLTFAYVLLVQIVCVASLVSEYNAVVNHDRYLEISRSLRVMKRGEERMRISVPSVMDAQLIAFYSGNDADYDFEIYEQQEFDRSIRQRLTDLGVENTITYYLEYGFRRSDRIKNPVVVIERFDDSFVRIDYTSSDR